MKSRIPRSNGRVPRWLLIVCVVLTNVPSAWAQEEELLAEQNRRFELYSSISWQEGPDVGQLGSVAEIQVPEDYQFTGKRGSVTWLELTENMPDPSVFGTMMPMSDEEGWFLLFSFDDCGYVEDDEKAELDADAILKKIQDGNNAANDERRKRGWPEMEVIGWIAPPSYDQETNNLTWATHIRSEGQDVVNHDTRLLGRRGVMSVTLVADPNELERLVPEVKQLLTSYQFTSGNKYAEWRSGDKIAAYGLTGLITGGAAVVAAKSGLLAKLAMVFAKGGKAIVVGILALLGGIWKFLTGRGNEASS